MCAARSPQERGRRGWARWSRIFQFRSAKRESMGEIDAEIGYHLDRTQRDLIDQGIPAGEAAERARRRFGDLDRHRRGLHAIDRGRARRERLVSVVGVMVDNLRLAIRGMRANPGFTAAVVTTLALGMGANATMFGILDRLLLRAPEHIVEPDRVVRFYVRRDFRGESATSATMTYPDYADLASVESLEAIAVSSGLSRMTLGEGEAAQRVPGRLISASYFDLLGVAPSLGRFFTDADEAAGIDDVVVVGHDFWQNELAADPTIVGRSIRVGGFPVTVIGVAPDGFTGADLGRVDLWLPLRSPANPANAWRADSGINWQESRGYYWLRAFGRLTAGAEVAAVQAETTAAHRAGRADDANYDPDAEMITGSLIAARGLQRTSASVVARWLMGVSGVVLLIACANVANLMLARSLRRRHEIGIRLALGVSRARLVGQLLTESLALALLGGGFALLVADRGGALVRTVLLPQVHWSDSPVHTRVLLFTAAVSLLTGLLAGVVPALQSSDPDLSDTLRGGERGGRGTAPRTRALLLVTQTALSVVLLVGAGLFLKSLRNVITLDMGFDTAGVVVALPEIDPTSIDQALVRPFYLDAVKRLTRQPGVEAASASQSMPFWSSSSVRLLLPGLSREEMPRFATGGPYINAVTEGYFDALGVRIVHGRGFTDDDVLGNEQVAVVEQHMADVYWPGEEPLGKCLLVGSGDDLPCTTVVGIAENARRQELVEDETAQYYVPLRQGIVSDPPMAIFVRTAPDRVGELLPTVRREIHAAGLSGAIRFVAPLLFDVAPFDPTVLAAVILGLLSVALIAASAPALRAANVDPIIVLSVD